MRVLVVSCFLSVLLNFGDRNIIHFLQMKEALSSNRPRNNVKIFKTVFLQRGLSVRKLDFQLRGVHLDYLIILVLSKHLVYNFKHYYFCPIKNPHTAQEGPLG